MWMMVISTSLSSSMFVTGAAPNVLGLEFVSKIAGIQISWLQWFLCFLPVGGYLAYHCAVAFLRAVQTGNHTQ